MISELNNKALTEYDCGTHVTVLDGPVLGGCGRGEVGDPNTWIPEVWKDVIDKYGVKSVLDVGCGYGYSTKWFYHQGLLAMGLEGSMPIVEAAREEWDDDELVDGPCPISHHDFRGGKPSHLGREFDLCWCSEFLEHVRKEYEPCYFAAIVRCRYALITAALPGFGGHHHVNEKPPEYWVERFGRYGFELLQDETNRLRELAHATNPGCYFQGNGLLFRRVKEVEVRTHWTDLGVGTAPDDAERLQGLARGRKVLLIGGFVDELALILGETAKQVTAVDVHPDGLYSLHHNVKSAGMLDRTEITFDDAASEEIAARRFEMVVIRDSYAEAVAAASKVLLPGGHVVWTGWGDTTSRDVVAEAGVDLRSVSISGSLGIRETAKYRVMVTLPHSRGVEFSSQKSVRLATIGRFADSVAEMDMDCGCLPHSFNCLLSQCLDWRDQGRCTHMAMIHSDVTAERGWVDLLAEEMHQHDLIAISAVVAIKDPDQDRTSTAIGSKSDPWHAKRYIHRRMHGRMPTTFTGKDVCEGDDEVLLINTGLMLLDLRHPFWDEFCFQVPTAIFKVDGKRAPIFRPEDWEMSRELDRAGVPYGATWRPFVEHLGGKAWDNRPMTVQVVENG